MSGLNGFNADLELDELLNPIDRGSGGISPAQRQLNAQQNLGLIALAGGASGGAQQSMAVSENYAILAADFGLQNVNTAQKFFNVSTNGAFNVLAGQVYTFEAMYNATNTGTTAHTWAFLFGGTATFTFGAMQGYGNSSGTANSAATGGLSGFSMALGTALVLTASSTSATEQVAMYVTGTFKVNAAGTVIPQIQLSAAPGGAQVAKAGSFIQLYPMVGTGAMGNWT